MRRATTCESRFKSSVWIIQDFGRMKQERRDEHANAWEAPARHGYHAISHAPGPRTQWRIRPHRPDPRITGNNYWQAKARGIWVRGNPRSAAVRNGRDAVSAQ